MRWMMILMGYRPFLDPWPMDDYWLFFLLPLVVAVAIVYRAVKLDDLKQLPRAAAVLSVQILFYMALAATALWLLTELV